MAQARPVRACRHAVHSNCSSPDNATWKSHGTLAVSGGTQNWRFLKPVTARYLRYRVMSPNGRTDVTEFNIYVAKQ